RRDIAKAGGQMNVTHRIRVPCREFSWSTARSSGPGGQNVNKVNSKVILRWSLVESESLPGDVRDRFIAAYRRRMTGEGELVLSSERFRDQPKNVADCLEKLQALLQSVATAPKPRRAVKPTRASKRRRVEAKRERTETKDRRRPPKVEE
ncbi:MAG: alternative ribosome rescue aminoacyl-tRNA hydrolase ArfB, partial [Schlesneria sp.]